MSKTVKSSICILLIITLLMSFNCLSVYGASSAAKNKTSVTLNVHSLRWYAGQTGTFKPTVTNNAKLSWKSTNTKIAKISADGKLTASSPGYCTIIACATDGSGVYDTCRVQVYKAATAVKLNKTSLNWYIGNEGNFKATVSPSDAGEKGVTYKSSNKKVAVVDANGKLKAVGVGTATITCTAKGGKKITASCKVTVYEKIKSFKLNKTSLKCAAGSTTALKVSSSPSTNTPDYKWSSSNTKVATVDANGKITAKAKGSCTITAKAKGKSTAVQTCKVTVYQPVKSIKLNTNSLKWIIGRSGTFKATVNPTNAHNKKLKWSSSNKKVATVDANGKLKAISAGTATITCSSTDGSNVKDTCKVTVIKPVLITELRLNCRDLTLTRSGDTFPLSATITPLSATTKALTWSSSNTKVASVSSSGIVTAVKKGSCTITVKTKDGSNIAAKCSVTVSE